MWECCWILPLLLLGVLVVGIGNMMMVDGLRLMWLEFVCIENSIIV